MRKRGGTSRARRSGPPRSDGPLGLAPSDRISRIVATSPRRPAPTRHRRPRVPATSIVLGSDLSTGRRPQAVVPPDAWQAATPLASEPVGYTLVSCTVAPPFRFDASSSRRRGGARELRDEALDAPPVGPGIDLVLRRVDAVCCRRAQGSVAALVARGTPGAGRPPEDEYLWDRRTVLVGSPGAGRWYGAGVRASSSVRLVAATRPATHDDNHVARHPSCCLDGHLPAVCFRRYTARPQRRRRTGRRQRRARVAVPGEGRFHRCRRRAERRGGVRAAARPLG